MSDLFSQLVRRVLQPSTIHPRAASRFETMPPTAKVHEQHDTDEAPLPAWQTLTTAVPAKAGPRLRALPDEPRQHPPVNMQEPTCPLEQTTTASPSHPARRRTGSDTPATIHPPLIPVAVETAPAVEKPTAPLHTPVQTQKHTFRDAEPDQLQQNPGRPLSGIASGIRISRQISEQIEQRLTHFELSGAAGERTAAAVPDDGPFPLRSEVLVTQHSRPQAPNVEIHIGRIEVRAPLTQKLPPVSTVHRQEARRLDDYLRERSGRPGQGGLS